MTDTAPEQSHADPDAVGVDIQAVISGYQAELADQVQRRIMSEAAAAALRAERADLRATIAALTAAADSSGEQKP